MSFSDFIAQFLTKDALAAVGSSTTWPDMERHLGRIYFGLGSYFSQADYSQVPSEYDGPGQLTIPASPRAQGAEAVQYLAVNFRGLYQRNGRQTILAPCGSFRTKFPNLETHRIVHELYMNLLTRKSRSINQLFIANTDLASIQVSFIKENHSHVALSDRHADFKIGNDISVLWRSALQEWQKKVLDFLNDPTDTKKQAIELSLATTREHVRQAVVKNEAKLLAAPFFAEWQKLSHQPPVETIGETTDRFHHWLSSICWLAFHCNPRHAGAHFYSVCLPNVLMSDNASGRTCVDSILPRSSVSVVAAKELPGGFLAEWRTLPATLCNNAQYRILETEAKKNGSSPK